MKIQPRLLCMLLPLLQACTAFAPATHAQPGLNKQPAAIAPAGLKACQAEVRQDTTISEIPVQKIRTFVQVNY